MADAAHKQGRPRAAWSIHVVCELRLLSQTKLAAGEVALLQAARADIHLALMAILHDGDTLDVRTELAVDRAEGVGDGTTGNGMLPADLTNLGHS